MNSTLKEQPATTKRSAKPKPTPSELIVLLKQCLDGQGLAETADKIFEQRKDSGMITSLEHYVLAEITDHLYGQQSDVKATIQYLQTQLTESTNTPLNEKTTSGKRSTTEALANRLHLFQDAKELASMAQSVLHERKNSGTISTFETSIWPEIIHRLNFQYKVFNAAIRYLEAKK